MIWFGNNHFSITELFNAKVYVNAKKYVLALLYKRNLTTVYRVCLQLVV